MPESIAPATPPYVNLNDGAFLFKDKPIGDDPALQAVVQTFNLYESQRYTNYDWRWLEADNLYIGNVQPRVWEGSKVPKASIPNNIAFDHVEAALAFIESAIFDIPEWFGCEAIQETSPKDAREVQAVYEDAFSTPYQNYSTARAEMRQAFKSGLVYGTGMMLMEWDGRRPVYTNLDLRDVYVDYGLKSARLDDARSVIIRQMISIDDLRELAGNDPRMDIPPESVLWYMTNNSPTAMGDSAKQQRELMRGSLSAGTLMDPVPIPAQNPVEVLRYYDRGRIIWVLNRIHVMMNIPNPYKEVPIISFPCRFQLGRFYGSGFPEAVKFQQRITEALADAHINELELQLNPPTTGPRDMKPSELIMRPGMTSFTDNPKDVVRHFPPGATKDVLGEITYYEQMAERRNGVSSIAQGAARPGNINRTAQGVAQQAEGTNSRLKHVIENITDFMMVPMLYKMRKMYQIHTTPDQVLLSSESEGQQPKMITAAVFHRPVKMIMDAASRMVTRDRMGQNLPLMMQYIVNGSVIDGLNQIGKTIDFEEVAKTVQDAGGLPRRYIWVRDLSEQEKQSKNQPPPQVAMQMQAKQQELQARDKATELKHQSEMAGHQTEIQKALIAKQPDPMEAQAKQMEAQMKQAEMQAKLSFQQQSNDQKMQAEQQKMQLKAQSEQQKVEAGRVKLQADVEAKQVEAQGKIQSHIMALNMQREAGDEKRRQMMMDRAAGVGQTNG